MAPVFIICIIGIVIGIAIWIYGIKIEEAFGGFFIGLCGGLVFIALTLFIIWIVSLYYPTEHINQSYKTTIYSMGDKLGVNGEMYLGTGYIESRMYYYYYYKKNDKFYSGKLDAESTSIQEDSQPGNGYIEYIYQHKVNPVDDWLNGYPKYERAENWIETIVHVPSGSVIKEFKFNLDK